MVDQQLRELCVPESVLVVITVDNEVAPTQRLYLCGYRNRKPDGLESADTRLDEPIDARKPAV